MRNKVIVIVAVLLVAGIAIVLHAPKKIETDAVTPAPAEKIYTLTDVKAHPNAASCWVAISANIYDLTAWINQHPGGPDKILNICGTDATTAFENQHGGQSRPEAELATFKIGIYQQ